MSVTSEVSRNMSLHSTRNVEYVGFANLPNQVFRRCVKRGFDFTLMVVGESGLGKSTFLNSLFLADIHDISAEQAPELHHTVSIESKTVRLIENDVRLYLTVVDTPGFGDLVDNSECWDPIVKYIDSKFSDYLTEETKLDRPPVIQDRRVHLCLYFIAPTGHSLKALDLEFLRALQDRVNIIPVIAKADTLTPLELSRFKQNILNELKRHNIQLYEFLDTEPLAAVNGNSKENKTPVTDFRSKVPFAVVSSTKTKEDHNNRNRRTRVREYPWGTVEVDNLAHNDFIALRDAIIRNNLIDLIDVTNNVHYENFRVRGLPKNNFKNDPFTELERESRKRELEAEQERNDKEKLFKEKISTIEKGLTNKAQEIDEEEKENNKVLVEKKTILERLRQEVIELRTGRIGSGGAWNSSGQSSVISHVHGDSGSSLLSRQSPPEKSKKKGIFGLK